MRRLEEILDLAAARHGGREAVLAGAPRLRDPAELAALDDAAWLAEMARCIFQAGISWKVVEAKWPGIMAAFDGFAPAPLAMMDDARLDALLADPRVIRSGAKIVAIRENAAFIQRAGGFAARVAAWPETDFAGLLIWLQEEGDRLGGNTGAYVLRRMGRDGWTLSRDVLARLAAEGVIARPTASPRAIRAMQPAFDAWRAESGLSFAAISRILALSIDG